MSTTAPTPDDARAARTVLARHLRPTPLLRAPALSELFGCDLHVKCESFQPTGAFKVRGGVNLVAGLSAEERRAGLVTASTGNQGQSIAFAGRLFGAPVTVFAPAIGTNPLKLAAMRDLGAAVRTVGRDFDEARQACEEEARRKGYRYVHSANESAHVAGVATIALEILDALPKPDAVVVPVGGGSGAAGLGLVLRDARPETAIYGVQSDAAPGAHDAWHGRHLRPHPRMATVHEGLATRVPFEMTMRMMWDALADFVLVSDGAIDDAIRMLAEGAKLVAEGAGAAATAAVAGPLRERLAGHTVVVILSGGNLPRHRMASILAP